MARIKELINKRISINLLYYIASVSLIFFVLSKSDLSIYEFSKYELIIFILIFMVSVYFESKRENIFLKILILHCFIFYILIIPYSIIQFIDENGMIFKRIINLQQLPKSILILCYQYLVLFFSIYLINPTINFSLKKIKINEINFLLNLLIFLSIANITFNTFGRIDYNSYLKFFAVFFNIFNSGRIVFTFTALIFLVYVSKVKIYNLLPKSILFYTIYLIDTSMSGSRSSIIFILLILLLCCLYYLKLKNLSILNLITIFFLSIISVIGFFVSTLLRNISYKHNFDVRYEFIVEDYTSLMGSIKNINPLAAILNRISYFDFYLEKLINYKYYEDYINLSYYYKPLLDRITPGFELYNVPLASKILQDSFYKQYFRENYLGNNYNSTVTNSEQITIFAESHILFGFYSIFYYFVIFYMLKIVLNFFKKINNQIFLQILNMTILLLFFDWITGFGMDITIMLSLYHFVFLMIILFILKAHLIFNK